MDTWTWLCSKKSKYQLLMNNCMQIRIYFIFRDMDRLKSLEKEVTSLNVENESLAQKLLRMEESFTKVSLENEDMKKHLVSVSLENEDMKKRLAQIEQYLTASCCQLIPLHDQEKVYKVSKENCDKYRVSLSLNDVTSLTH